MRCFVAAGGPKRIIEDGLPHVFAINALAPYILTALIQRPKRLIYLSSGLHRSGDTTLQDLAWEKRTWNGTQAYSHTKLHDVLLAFAVARLWPDALSNALEPGWVPTKMEGPLAGEVIGSGGSSVAIVGGIGVFLWLRFSLSPPVSIGGSALDIRPRCRSGASLPVSISVG